MDRINSMKDRAVFASCGLEEGNIHSVRESARPLVVSHISLLPQISV